jgi:hypothetical protein
MTAPVRWRDDRALLDELGLDLESESRSLPRHDIAAMQARLEASIASGAAPAHDPFAEGGALEAAAEQAGGVGAIAGGQVTTAAASSLAGIVIAALLIGAAGGAGVTVALGGAEVQRERPLPTVDVPPATKVEEAAPTPTAPKPAPTQTAARAPSDGRADADAGERRPAPTPANAAARTPSTSADRSPPRTPAGGGRKKARSEQAPVERAPERRQAQARRAEQLQPKTPAPPAEPSGPSALERELAAYTAADRLLRGGRAEQAAQRFERYLADHPRGTLVIEARLGLLQAHQRAGDARAVVRAGLPLLGDAAYAAREREVRRLVERALGDLRRCQGLRRALRAGDAEAIARLKGRCEP